MKDRAAHQQIFWKRARLGEEPVSEDELLAKSHLQSESEAKPGCRIDVVAHLKAVGQSAVVL